MNSGRRGEAGGGGDPTEAMAEDALEWCGLSGKVRRKKTAVSSVAINPGYAGNARELLVGFLFGKIELFHVYIYIYINFFHILRMTEFQDP